MASVDVAVVGGGLAGSSAAAMLARAGIATVLIEPHAEIRPDFRCEKFDHHQLELLCKTGLEDVALPVSTRADRLWVARHGHLLDKKPNNQRSFHYHEIVGALRAAACEQARFIASRVIRVETGPERQRLELANGETVSARLVVLANGLNFGLRRALGIDAEILSSCHSLSVGFDIEPPAGQHFRFPALTYFPERRRSRMAYLTLFPIGETMRANLFLYRTMDDPWLTILRRSPEETLNDLMPRLRALTGDFDVVSVVKVRPVDLYVATGHRRDGVVLVGDAFSTSCPAAGTGAHKVFTDVERLCATHIPRWLATPGMGAAKLASFYDDHVKQACDAFSLRRAYELRSISLDPGVSWRARRTVKFLGHLALGRARETMRQWSTPSGESRNHVADGSFTVPQPPAG